MTSVKNGHLYFLNRDKPQLLGFIHEQKVMVKGTHRKRNKSAKEKKSSIYDFVGVLTPNEADEMKEAIEETCETIHPDDWK